MTSNLHDLLDVQRRLVALRGSAFRGTARHTAAADRLRRQAAAMLAADPDGPQARSLSCVLEMIAWMRPAASMRAAG